ncbi:hypothetical protein Tco_1057148 [Tanacetum coccineum]|uniref:Uncharacterized protein n=1 Tax=Tanacetum coccineum TaxID=301880 RepID=A0ABQ5H4P5_9ASTR
MLCDQIAVLKRYASFNESDFNALKIQIQRLKKEKESNQIKIDNFENASKSLDKLIGCQISDNNRKGVGYNVVAPPPTGLFAPPSIDFSNSSLEEFKQSEFKGYGVKVVSLNLLSRTRKFGHSTMELRPRSSMFKRRLIIVDQASFFMAMTSDHNRSELGIQVHSNEPSSSKLVPKVVPLAVKTATSRQELEITIPQSYCNAEVNSVNTAKGKRVTIAVGEQGINAVKSKACWVLRPKIKVLDHVGDEAVHKELGDKMKRAATTTSSFKTEQDSGGYILGSDEGSKKLNELMELCTKLSKKVTSLQQDLKQTKQVYGKALTKLVKKVKHLEDQLKSTTKRRKAKVVISDEEEDLVSKDPSKQGRMLETEYEDVETEHAKEESSKVHLDVLTAVMELMLGRRLQVEEDSEVARDLVMKIIIEANKPRS